MSNSFIQEEQQEGVKKDIAALVVELRNFMGSTAAIAQSLVRRLGLSLETAMEKVQQY